MSTSTLQISCRIGTTDPTAQLAFEIRLDGTRIFHSDQLTDTLTFEHVMDEQDADHCLEFELMNKTASHTVLDQAGNIVKDACITISDLSFDQIEIQQIFLNCAVYTHDFNGTQAQTQDQFFGTMGCNGVVKLRFSTPFYVWLLENM